MDPRWLLRKLAAGHLRNVAFRDAVALIESFGFTLARAEGSHHIFKRSGVNELLNLQDVRGEAKPYQLRQFLRLVERYNLKMDNADE